MYTGKSTLAKNTQVFWVNWQISYNGIFSGGKITAAFLVWRQMVQRQMLQRQNFGGFINPIARKGCNNSGETEEVDGLLTFNMLSCVHCYQYRDVGPVHIKMFHFVIDKLV